jgi:hypothetical protein
MTRMAIQGRHPLRAVLGPWLRGLINLERGKLGMEPLQ